MTIGRLRCPHCGEQGIPRWLAACSSCWFPARCERCCSKAKLPAWVHVWTAVGVGFAPFGLLFVLPDVAHEPTSVYALVLVYAAFFGLPTWFVRVRPASPHDGESILRSARRHWRQLRKRR